jgi:hypothetical protein
MYPLLNTAHYGIFKRNNYKFVINGENNDKILQDLEFDNIVVVKHKEVYK